MLTQDGVFAVGNVREVGRVLYMLSLVYVLYRFFEVHLLSTQLLLVACE